MKKRSTLSRALAPCLSLATVAVLPPVMFDSPSGLSAYACDVPPETGTLLAEGK